MGHFEKLGIFAFLCILSTSTALPPIHVDLIPLSNWNRPGTALSGTRYITIHNTANTGAGANARAHANYVKNPSTEVSWHFTVDDHEIYQHLPTNEVGYHAGTSAGNSQSIGIEICENSDGDFEKAVKNSQELVAKLMADHNVPIGRVVQHQYWSGKLCPRKLLDRWQAFLDGIGNSDPSQCYGTVRASGGLLIRSAPNTDASVVGSLTDGSYVRILGRVTGSNVSGNPYWFEVGGGYASAYYITPSSGSNQPWCRQS